MSRAPCSPSTEPPAPKGPKATTSNLNEAQRKRRAACINRRQRAFFCFDENRILVSRLKTGCSSPRAPYGNCVPFWMPILGCSFPTAPVSETTSHFEPSDWDALSGRGPKRKPHPTLSVHSGTQFPNGPRFGNRIPFRAFRLGCAFPQNVDAENVSHLERSSWDAVSQRRLARRRRAAIDYLPSSSWASSRA